MAAAPASAQFTGTDGDDFHSCLAQQRVGVSISVVTDDDARLQRHNVIAVIPLLTLGCKAIASRLHHAQRLEVEGFGNRVQERAFFAAYINATGLFRPGEG